MSSITYTEFETRARNMVKNFKQYLIKYILKNSFCYGDLKILDSISTAAYYEFFSMCRGLTDDEMKTAINKSDISWNDIEALDINLINEYKKIYTFFLRNVGKFEHVSLRCACIEATEDLYQLKVFCRMCLNDFYDALHTSTMDASEANVKKGDLNDEIRAGDKV